MKPIYIYIGGMASISIALYAGYMWGQDVTENKYAQAVTQALEQRDKEIADLNKALDNFAHSALQQAEVSHERERRDRDRIREISQISHREPNDCTGAVFVTDYIGLLNATIRDNQLPHRNHPQTPAKPNKTVTRLSESR